MRPKPYVRLQSVAVLLVSLICLGLFGREAALTLGTTLSVGIAVWAYFRLLYGIRLRKSDRKRSADRAVKDRVMLDCLLVGLLLPCGVAWVAFAVDGLNVIDPPLSGGEAVFTSLCVSLIPLSMLVSSSVDWYLIRPFREGVHGPPACHPEVQQTTGPMDYARYWIMHRMVAEFLVYSSIVGLIALTATIVGERTDSETGKNVFNLIGLIGIVSWSVSELGKLKAALEFVRYPTCGLAEWVTGRNGDGQDIAGFALDVSIDPGVQLIEAPRGHPARDIAERDRSVPLKYRRTIKSIPAPVPVCAGQRCEFWVPDCEIGLSHPDGASSGEDRQPGGTRE